MFGGVGGGGELRQEVSPCTASAAGAEAGVLAVTRRADFFFCVVGGGSSAPEGVLGDAASASVRPSASSGGSSSSEGGEVNLFLVLGRLIAVLRTLLTFASPVRTAIY